MVERVPLDKNREFAKEEPDRIISTSASDFSLSFAAPGSVEHENIHSDLTPSEAIAVNTAADLGMPVTQTYQERFVGQLDEFRKDPYMKETHIELKALELSWPPSVGVIKVIVKRGLRIIKSYKKEGK